MVRKTKKTAKKVTKKKAVKQSSTKLPRGYTAISGFGQSWPNDDTKPGDMIQGEVIEFDEYDGQYGVQQTAKIETKEGEVFTVYESAMLAPLFEYEEGVSCAIIFDGLGVKKKGKNPPKLFRIGINE